MRYEDVWQETQETNLMQGDYLPSCAVPILAPEFPPSPGNDEDTSIITIDEYDLIVMTQSCDFEPHPPRVVTLCPVYSLDQFEVDNPDFARKGVWEEVRKRRREGLHMMPFPLNRQKLIVVDFREIYSLPHDYLTRHVAELEIRWRLQTPYVEDLSQSFAKYFMRVALPYAIPSFR